MAGKGKGADLTMSAPSASKLDMILARDAAGEFQLWGCRGAGKGCNRNRYRKQKKPCADCFGPLPPQMMLGEVVERLAKGDA
jgi:hypothetical protein